MGRSRENTEVGCHFLLQWILPTQGSNPCLTGTPGLGGRFFYHWATWEAPTMCIQIHSKRSEKTQMGVLSRKGMQQTLWFPLNYYVCMIFIITIYMCVCISIYLSIYRYISYLYIEGAENQGQDINSTWNNIIYISFYQLRSLGLS